MLDTSDWSARKKLKHSLLKRAFEENRGPEVILLIQWRMAHTKHNAGKDKAALKAARRHARKARALRALDLIEEKNGRAVRYEHTPPEETKAAPAKNLSFKDFFQKLVEVPLDERIMHHDNLPAANAPAYHDRYDPMEGLKVTSGYEMACSDFEKYDRLLRLHIASNHIEPSLKH